MAKTYYKLSELVFQPLPNRPNFRNLNGLVFERLTVLGFAVSRSGMSYWYCQCECGNINRPSTPDLTRNDTKSCGCYGREKVTIHGGKGTKIYITYVSAKRRIQSPHYKARGIEFRFTSFTQFLNCVGEQPTAFHELCREKAMRKF